MRFFVGALALAVICVLFGSPAVLLLGWSPLTAKDRPLVKTGVKQPGQAAPHRPAAW